MKKIFSYLNIATLFIALSAMFVSCTDNDANDDGNLGLNIKVFAPTVVVPGSSMTINGSGFADVTEIVFPGDIVVEAPNFEIVTGEMIRVKAPADLKEGGVIAVRNEAGETAVSRLPLSIGKTEITGYYPTPDPEKPEEDVVLKGKETLTVYGKGMQFVTRVEFKDEDGNPIFVEAKDFLRVANGRIVVTVPAKVLEDKYSVKIYLHDGTVVESPKYVFEANRGGGHWEETRRFIWENETGEAIPAWGGKFRFCEEGHDFNSECVAEIPSGDWSLMKEGTFYALITPADGANVRITTGWWASDFGGKEHNCIEEAEDDIETAGNKVIAITPADYPDFLEKLDEQHLLFTGDAYTLVGIYVLEREWVEEESGHYEKVRTSFWKNETGEAIPAWGGTFRFSSADNSTGEEIYAFPMEEWEIIKTQPIRIAIEVPDGANGNVRITTGWWSADYGGKEHNCIEEAEVDENGVMFIELNLSMYEDFWNSLDVQHLLFTGSDYTLLEIYQEEEVWVEDGGESAPEQVVFWENLTDDPIPAWGGTFRFGLDGHDGNNECIATFDEDTWSVIKDDTFYALVEPADGANVRITTGWWSSDFGGKEHNCIEEADDDLVTGLKVIAVTAKDWPDFCDALDAQHLLFTGDAYTLKKLYYIKK